MAAGKVLIVDDIQDWRVTLSGLLMDQGYEVQVASSVDSALQRLENESFHVAILDVRLDESNEDNRDGLVLMRKIKERWPSIEVIILTGYAEINMAQEALNSDASGNRFAHSFLEKTQTNELTKQIELALKKSIKYLISQGEQENVEFKSSARWDHAQGVPNKNLQKVIAKTIAGMMNSKGGTLLIGVADDGTILGIDKDLPTLRKPTIDEFELLLIDIIQNSLGLESIECVNIRFESVDEKIVCLVAIKPSSKPIFLISGDDSEFWVRIRNSTRQLKVKVATEYIQSHWGR